jgi:hypothetical protein
MNRKTRHSSMRSLGTAGSQYCLPASGFGQSAAPREPYSTWSDFRRSHGLDAVLLAKADYKT